MNRQNLRAAQRDKYAAATIETGIPKGNETAETERQRMTAWLRKRGEPNFSAFNRRKRK